MRKKRLERINQFKTLYPGENKKKTIVNDDFLPLSQNKAKQEEDIFKIKQQKEF